MKVKCYSVRLKDLERISVKAYKATCFNGAEGFIPASQVFGYDMEVKKSDAYWISAWILEKSELQYSDKKVAWFDSETRRMLPSYTVKRHTPSKQNPIESNEIDALKKSN